MSIDEILKTYDVNDFIPDLADHVEQKCGYDGNMDALSDPERIFLIALTCEIEVNNGGFAQYFYNSSGNYAGELENAFQKIGAVKLAEICRTALDAFGAELPSDVEERRELLAKLKSDEIDNVLDECDNAFYRYEEDLNSLIYAYVLKNKADFS